MDKKGISPLIATVILIAFAVALGSTVINWGSRYYLETQQHAEETTGGEMKCAIDVGIKLVEIDGVQQICYDNSTSQWDISFTIENTKPNAINVTQLRITGTKGIYSTLINSTIDGGSALKVCASCGISASYNYTQYGNITQIKLTPGIYIKRTSQPPLLVLCPNGAVSVSSDALSRCS